MKFFTAILGAALAIGSTLYAQIQSDLINVNFANPVVVNGVTIPAGETSIQVVRNNGTVMLTVRSESGPHSMVLVSRSESMDNDVHDARVILEQKDGAFRLNRVLLADHTILQVQD